MVERFTCFDSKHETMIHDSQFDFYGTKIATCSSDGYISIYSINTKENQISKLLSHPAHNLPALQVSWSHPKYGSLLASCGFDKKAIVWRLKENTLEDTQIVIEHLGSVNSVMWAPCEAGLILASVSSDGVLKITDIRDDGKLLTESIQAHDMGINAVTWAPISENSQKIKLDQSEKFLLATGSSDRSIKIWRWGGKSGIELVNEFIAHERWIRDISWCPSQLQDFEIIASCAEDQTIKIWKIDFLSSSNFCPEELLKENLGAPVWRVSWSLGGTMLAVSCGSSNLENAVKVYKENESGHWEAIVTPLILQKYSRARYGQSWQTKKNNNFNYLNSR